MMTKLEKTQNSILQKWPITKQVQQLEQQLTKGQQQHNHHLSMKRSCKKWDLKYINIDKILAIYSAVGKRHLLTATAI